ncbi:MAG: hypothetical protein QXT86_08855 [Archaeoglobaceae archaeon]
MEIMVLGRSKTIPLTKVEELKNLLQAENILWYKVARLSYEIVSSEEWRQLGYRSLMEFFTKEIASYGLSYTTFMYRVKMGEVIVKYNLREDVLAQIQWSKFKEIASLLLMKEDMDTAEAERKILELKDLPVVKIAEIIRQEKEQIKQPVYKRDLSVLSELPELSGLEERNIESSFFESEKEQMKEEITRSDVFQVEEVKVKRYSFTVVGDHVDIVEKALEKAQEYALTSNISLLFVYICADFLASDEEEKEKLLDLIHMYERKRIHSPHRRVS